MACWSLQHAEAQLRVYLRHHSLAPDRPRQKRTCKLVGPAPKSTSRETEDDTEPQGAARPKRMSATRISRRQTSPSSVRANSRRGRCPSAISGVARNKTNPTFGPRCQACDWGAERFPARDCPTARSKRLAHAHQALPRCRCLRRNSRGSPRDTGASLRRFPIFRVFLRHAADDVGRARQFAAAHSVDSQRKGPGR